MIAFAVSGDKGKAGIYTAQPDGTDVNRLTNATDGDPDWSPDGRALTFTRTRTTQQGFATRVLADIYVVNADGSGLQRLTTDGVSQAPAWSATGNEITYHYDDIPTDASGNEDLSNAENRIRVMDADGGNDRPLLELGGYPAPSPNGKTIAYVGGGPGGSEFVPGLWLARADGTEAERLTTDESFALAPTWSPDGTTIVYVGGEEGTDGLYSPLILETDKRGGPVDTLATLKGDPIGGGAGRASYSPDGKQLVFASQKENTQELGISIMDLASGDVRRIPGLPAGATFPDWGPSYDASSD